MKIGRRSMVGGAIGAAALPWRMARADQRSDTLLVVNESGPNVLDPEITGANRGVYEVAWNCYDRLLTFGLTKDADGFPIYDYKTLLPELAEAWDQHGLSVTFRLRRDATFHDGTPVTARDVKWSLDRAIGVGGYSKFIFGSVSMKRPEQFVLLDDQTFRLDLDQPDSATLRYLASPVASIFNSALVQKHATDKDPWGLDYTRANVAGGGAYMMQSFNAGTEMTCVRNSAWKCGKLPEMTRVIVRTVPAAGTRRALLERGDVDVSFDMPPKDANDLQGNPAISVISPRMENTLQFLSMNVTMPLFDNRKVREAIAWAVPYDDIVKLALFGRALSMGGGADKVTSPDWPQKIPYDTDIAKARQLLTEAGYPNGFDTTLSYDLSNAAINEPLCVLLQNNLAQIGIRVSLNKVPAANWRSELTAKKLPFLVHVFGGWLGYPYMFFGWVYYDKTAMHDTASYEKPIMKKLIDDSHYNSDAKQAADDAVQYIQLAIDDLPIIPLFQPNFNIGTRKNISGAAFWFFRQLDYRTIRKT